MEVTDTFKNAIADVFYDKTISIFNETELKDAHGHTRITIDTESPDGSFLGNAQFRKLGLLKEEYGLKVDADIAITCAIDVEVSKNNVLGYLDSYYRVVECITFDSHKLIIGEEWVLP